MGKVLKILKRILIIAVSLFVIVLLLRTFNDYQYKKYDDPQIPEYYSDVNNISLYPTDIEGIDVQYVDEGSLQGFHFVPKEKLHKGVVLCFGGSEGSPNFEVAQRLAQDGYETFALFMYGMKNQTETLMGVPLEQFEDIHAYFNNDGADPEPITVIGASKGAEYALNLASKYDDIDNLVLIAPSSYNFVGLDFNQYGSSWTYQGEELPYIDIQKSSFVAFIKNIIYPMTAKAPISYKDTYSSAVASDEHRQDKMIPMQDVQANVLLIAGEEDVMWDSVTMAKEIESQVPNAELHIFEGAGHIFGGYEVLNMDSMRLATGGSLEANQKAEIESQKVIDDFLSEHHQKN